MMLRVRTLEKSLFFNSRNVCVLNGKASQQLYNCPGVRFKIPNAIEMFDTGQSQ